MDAKIAPQGSLLQANLQSRLAIEHLETVDIGRAVPDRRHQTLLCM